MQQDKIALPFARADMVERKRVQRFGKPRQLMIMGCEQTAAPVHLVDRLDHRPGEREPVIGRGAAPDLVENHEALRGRLREDRRGLDHLDHEGRSPARQIVARPHAAEQSVDQPEGRGACRYEGACLREHDDQSVLAQEGRFTAHIGAGDKPKPVGFGQRHIIGDEAFAAFRQRRLDHRMSPAPYVEARFVGDVRPAPVVAHRMVGERRGDVDPREHVAARGDRLAALGRGFGQRFEMRSFGCHRMHPRLGHARRRFVQIR